MMTKEERNTKPLLLLIGCGKMGGALLEGWLEKNLTNTVVVVEPQRNKIFINPRVQRYYVVEELPNDVNPDMVVLAVKPQIIASILPSYKRFVSPKTVFISIIAGMHSSWFTEYLGPEVVFMRTMPNTAVAVGSGMTVAFANKNVTQTQKDVVNSLFEALGGCVWISDEAWMDVVTAISGGGPAYIFLITELLEHIGMEHGLPETLARQLARATVIGSGELLRHSHAPASTLRKDVTSPGGTTQAALNVLLEPKSRLKLLLPQNNLESLFQKAIQAAIKRARVLAQGAKAT